MTLILASIITKEGGRLLLSRHFVDSIPKEGLERTLAKFPSLIKERGDEEQQCYIDCGAIRYLFRSIDEEHFIVLLSNPTSFTSSLPEEIEALDYCYRLVEQYIPKDDILGQDGIPIAIMSNSLEIILSWDEVISSGLALPESIDWSSLAQSLEMESAEEAIQEAILKEQERETKDLAKKKLKQIEIDRKAAASGILSGGSGCISGRGGSSSGGNLSFQQQQLQLQQQQPHYNQQPQPHQYQAHHTQHAPHTPTESGGMKFGSKF